MAVPACRCQLSSTPGTAGKHIRVACKGVPQLRTQPVQTSHQSLSALSCCNDVIEQACNFAWLCSLHGRYCSCRERAAALRPLDLVDLAC